MNRAFSRQDRFSSSSSTYTHVEHKRTRAKLLRRAANSWFERLEDRQMLTVTSGQLDLNFGAPNGFVTTDFSSPTDHAQAVAIQSNGKIVVAGTAQNRFVVARYNSDGSLDSSFGTGGRTTTQIGSFAQANAVAILSGGSTDGDILLAGYALNAAGTSSNNDFVVARYLANGLLDTSFGTGGYTVTDIGTTIATNSDDVAYAMAVRPTGEIVLAGGTQQPGDPNLTNSALVQYTAAGALDSSYGVSGKIGVNLGIGSGSNLNDYLASINIEADGRITAAGQAAGKFVLARFTNTGLDTGFGASSGKTYLSFGTDHTDTATGMVVQGSKYIVAGYSVTSGSGDFAMARFSGSGLLDTSFGAGGTVVTNIGGDDRATAIALQRDQKIVLAGTTLNQATGDSRFAVARYYFSEGIDYQHFGTNGMSTTVVGGPSVATSMAIQKNGQYVVVGYTNGGTNPDDFAIARYQSNSAPELQTAATTVAGIGEDSTASAGTSVSDLVGGLSVYDQDGDTPGIAVTGVNSPDIGKWQFSTNGGGAWSDVPAVSITSALLLAHGTDNLIRFVPAHGYFGSATFTFRLWDQVAGTNGSLGTNDNNTFSAQSATTTITVTEVPLLASGVAVSATEWAAVNSVKVAHFTDAVPAPVPGDYTATISWGDADTTASYSIVAATGGGFDVLATKSHPYAGKGIYAIHVHIADSGGSAVDTSSTATVIDAPLTAVILTVPTATEGAAITNAVLFHFTDADLNATVSDYVATVTWGDGAVDHSNDATPVVSVVAHSGGGFDVIGSHTYLEEAGGLNFSVSVQDLGGAAPISASATIKVADALLSLGTLTPPAATEGAAWSGPVLHFTDADPNGMASDYTATITWGDGTKSVVTSTTTAADGGYIVAHSGGFDVIGSHTYLEEATGLGFSVAVADHGSTDGFETGTGGFSAANSIVQVLSGGGSLGLASSSGTHHAELLNQLDGAGYSGYGDGGFTRFGGRVSTYSGDFYQSVDIYLDTASAPVAALGTPAFWLDMSPTSSSTGVSDYRGEHNFRVSHDSVGTFQVTRDGQTTPFATLSDTGWYTFEITYKKGATPTAVVTSDLNIYDSAHHLVASDANVPANFTGDMPSSELGGNSYAWITNWQNGFANDVLAIDNLSTGLLPVSASATINVADAPLTNPTGLNFGAATGQAFSNVPVATFTDPAGSEVPSEYNATIDWGDGNNSPGTIVDLGGGHFRVTGGHAYSAAGSFDVSVSITHGALAAVTASGGTATIVNAVWVNDNWMSAAHPGSPVFGDIVTVPSGEVAPTSPATLTFGVNAFSTVQDGINADPVNGTVYVLAGNFPEKLAVNKSVTVVGAGASYTMLSMAGISAVANAIEVSADSVNLSGFTLDGGKSSATRYGIDSNGTTGLDIHDVTVQNLFRTGINLNGVHSVILDHVTVLNNGGSGIGMTDVQPGAGVGTFGAHLSNIITSGNAWNAVAVMNTGHYYPLGSHGIVISGTNTFGEVASDNGALQLEEMDWNHPTVPSRITWSTLASDNADVTIQPADFGYALGGPQAMDDGAYVYNRTRFYETRDQAQAAATGSPAHFLPHDRFIRTTNGLAAVTTYYVFDLSGDTMSIQAAINDAKAGDTINVQAGTYVENVSIGKGVTVLGPNAGVAGSGARGAEAIVKPATDNAENGVVIRVASSNVKIDGLEIVGKNAALGGGATVGTVSNVNAGYGIYADNANPTTGGSQGLSGSFDHLTFQNNMFQNFVYQGVWVANTFGSSYSENYIASNYFTNMKEGVQTYALHAHINDNVMEHVVRGVSIHGTNTAPSAGFADQINGNTITLSDWTPVIGSNSDTSRGVGIWVNYWRENAAPLTVANNTITVAAVAPSTKTWIGIYGLTGTDNTTVNFDNNTINGGGFASLGYYFSAVSTPSVTVSGGSISGTTDAGVKITNWDPIWGGQIGDNDRVTISDVTITPTSGAGVWVYADPAHPSTAQATLTAGTTITGGTTGIEVAGGSASITGVMFSDNGTDVIVHAGATISSLTGNTFTGMTYIDYSPAAELYAGGNTFGGIAPTDSGTTLAQLYTIEDKIADGIDYAGRGLVRLVNGNVYVTANKPAGGTDGRIGRAVTLATSGDVAHVAAGTFDEQVVISKTLTLQGAGDSTVIQPSSASKLGSVYTYPAGFTYYSGVTISGIVQVTGAAGTGVTMRDLKIDGTNVTSLPSGAARLAGIVYGESSGLIDNVTINSIKTTGYADRSYGIDLSSLAAATVEVSNNRITDFARNGILGNGPGLIANVHDNIITGPGAIGPDNVPNGIVFMAQLGGSIVHNTISNLHYDVPNSWLSVGILEYDTCQPGIVIENNEISNADVATNTYNGAIIRSNYLHGNGVGVMLEAGAYDNQVTGNIITGNTNAIQINGPLNLANPYGIDHPGTGNFAHNNNLSGNTLGLVNYDNTQTFDASGNYWGASTESAVAAKISGIAHTDFTPWLNNGTDTKADAGFQGDFSSLGVTALGQQAGSLGRIQEAVDLGTSSATISVYAGTYNEGSASRGYYTGAVGGGAAVGLLLYKNGQTLQGVSSSGMPITDRSNIAATIHATERDASAGDTIVTGDGVTITGLKFSRNEKVSLAKKIN